MAKKKAPETTAELLDVMTRFLGGSSDMSIDEIKDDLSGKYHITHVTLQCETKECESAFNTCYEDAAGGKVSG